MMMTTSTASEVYSRLNVILSDLAVQLCGSRWFLLFVSWFRQLCSLLVHWMYLFYSWEIVCLWCATSQQLEFLKLFCCWILWDILWLGKLTWCIITNDFWRTSRIFTEIRGYETEFLNCYIRCGNSTKYLRELANIKGRQSSFINNTQWFNNPLKSKEVIHICIFHHFCPKTIIRWVQQLLQYFCYNSNWYKHWYDLLD